MGLCEVTRRIANTEAGKDQLAYEKAIAWMDAYGAMYFSMNRGQEFKRTYIAANIVLSYNIMEEDED
jgi:hypothetical protein